MTVLTIKEPWASLINKKVKTIETRSWKTNYRGELYIHAGLSTIKIENKKLAKLVDNLNNGSIICKCKLIDCIYMDEEFINKIKKNKIEYLCGNYKEGRYAWILDDITSIIPIKAKGKLGIWAYKK